MHRAVSETSQFRRRRLRGSSTCRRVNLHRLHTDQRTMCTPVINRSKARRLVASGTFCGEETLGHTASLLPMLLKVRPGEQHRAVASATTPKWLVHRAFLLSRRRCAPTVDVVLMLQLKLWKRSCCVLSQTLKQHIKHKPAHNELKFTFSCIK